MTKLAGRDPARASPVTASYTTDSKPQKGSSLRRLLSAIRWSLVFDRFDVYARGVLATDRDFRAPDGYQFRFGDAQLLDRAQLRHTDLKPLDLEHGRLRLESGHQLVCGLHADTPVFTMWVNPRNLNVPGELKRRLNPDQVFIYKAFTSPDHRGRKLYQAGMSFVLAELAQSGRREVIGYAHTGKRASRSGLDRVGFTSIGHYRVCGVRERRRILVSARLDRRFPERVARSGVGWVGVRST